MKKLYWLLFGFILLLNSNVIAQQNVFSRSDVSTGNWWDVANPWFYSSWGNQNRPDNDGRANVFIGHNNNTTMTTNGAFFQLRTLTLQAAANVPRTINNLGGGISLSVGLYNESTANHVFNTPIGIDGGTVEIFQNNGSGGLSFSSNIFLNANIAAFGGTGNISASGVLSGTGGITKAGSGALTLSGVNTFSGSSNLNAGTLFVNGSLAAGSAVTIASGATLAGTGTAAGTVAVNGNIAPGATASSIGTLNTGALTFNNSSSYTFNINNVAGTAGTNWDLVNTTGAINVNALSSNPVTIFLNGNPAGFNPCQSYTWRMATGSGGITSFAANEFTVNTTGFTPTFSGIFSVAQSGNDINLVYTPALPSIAPGTNPAVCQGATTALLTYSSAANSPNQYSIDYDAAANTAGFTDVSNAALPVSPITLTVPAAAAAATYNGMLTVRNSITGCVSASYSITVTINLCALTISTGTISGSPFCAGAGVSVPYTVSGSFNPGNIFTAQLSDASGGFSSPVNIGTLTSQTNGTISATLPTGTAGGTGYRIRVLGSNPVTTGTTNTTDLIINALPAVFNVTGGGAYCSGGSGVAVGLSGSQNGINYQLRLNSINTGSPVAGTGSSISFGNQTGAGTYTVVATNATSSCTNTMNGSVNISVNPLPQASMSGNTICQGAQGQLTLNISSGISPFSAIINSANYSGITHNTAFNAAPNPAATTNYTLTSLTDANGCTRSSGFTGAGATITVNPLPVGGTASASSTNICNGNTVQLSLSGNIGTITWQRSADISSFSDIPGANITPYTTPALTEGWFYRARVTAGSCGDAVSNTLAVTVNESNSAATTYNTNWSNTQQDNTFGLGPWSLSTSGAAGFFANVSSDINTGGDAWGMFANSGGAATALRTLSNDLPVNGSIGFSMDNGTIQSGGSVGFRIRNASNANRLSFYFSGGGSFYTIEDNAGARNTAIGFRSNGMRVAFAYTGANTYALTISATDGTVLDFITGNLAGSGAPRQVIFFNNNAGPGAGADAFFNQLSLNVPAIATQPANQPGVCAGSGTASFSALAAGTGLSYQWQESTNGGGSWGNITNNATYSGTTTNNLIITGPTSGMNNYRYRAIVTGNCGATTRTNGNATLTVTATGTWTGNSSTDWHTGTNWCGNTVPINSTVVVIPSGAPRYPVISTADAPVASISIATGASVTMSGTRTLAISAGGSFANSGTFTPGTGTVEFLGSGTISGSSTTFHNVIIRGAVDFGNNISTIDGTLTRAAGGSVINNAPRYTNISRLLYTGGGTVARGPEWSHGASPSLGTTAGYPNDVQFSNNTTFDYPNNNNNNSTNLSVARDLIIDGGSRFFMDFGTGASSGAVTVGRDFLMAGDVSLGDGAGGNLLVGRNFAKTGGTWNGNGRELIFNGNTAQSLTSDNNIIIQTLKNINSSTIPLTIDANITIGGGSGGGAFF
jgi:autotransporter-associated beta strand protein